MRPIVTSPAWPPDWTSLSVPAQARRFAAARRAGLHGPNELVQLPIHFLAVSAYPVNHQE
ncbi:hypothetical protein M2284_001631 [Rhodococcus sp. LBL1]|nr:hypothetical protein [Rhodococcus sp. LBL1]MDH6682273.1 hypothetical protein [Rhodococcus sp. LBL2]